MFTMNKYKALMIYIFFIVLTPLALFVFDNYTRSTEIKWSYQKKDMKEMPELKLSIYKFLIFDNSIFNDILELENSEFVYNDIKQFLDSTSSEALLNNFYETVITNINEVEYFSENWSEKKFNLSVFSKKQNVDFSKDYIERAFLLTNKQLIEEIAFEFNKLILTRIRYMEENIIDLNNNIERSKLNLKKDISNSISRLKEMQLKMSGEDSLNTDDKIQNELISTVISNLLRINISLDNDALLDITESVTLFTGIGSNEKFSYLDLFPKAIDIGLNNYNSKTRTVDDLEDVLDYIKNLKINLNENFQFLEYSEPLILQNSLLGSNSIFFILGSGIVLGLILATSLIFIITFRIENLK